MAEFHKIEDPLDRFFAFAVERHCIYLRRATGAPPPWTEDRVLRQYRFTNVFRELDATTVWFRENVRDRLQQHPDVLLATVLFRWFNRITTGEAVFCQTQIPDNKTAWERRGKLHTLTQMQGWCAELRSVIRAYCGRGPYVTGAYIIKGSNGMDKLEGVLDAFYKFLCTVRKTDIVPNKVLANWRAVADTMMSRRGEITLQQTWEWMKEFHQLGPFMAYEVVTDLRHTALLDRAPDIMTWANPGPGAQRGLARVKGRFRPKREGSSKLALSAYVPTDQMLEEMRVILRLSKDNLYWPSKWPAWEMREVEHTLCEFDKWERAHLGQGRPRQIMRYAA